MLEQTFVVCVVHIFGFNHRPITEGNILVFVRGSLCQIKLMKKKFPRRVVVIFAAFFLSSSSSFFFSVLMIYPYIDLLLGQWVAVPPEPPRRARSADWVFVIQVAFSLGAKSDLDSTPQPEVAFVRTCDDLLLNLNISRRFVRPRRCYKANYCPIRRKK